jgi:hypothetical protein
VDGKTQDEIMRMRKAGESWRSIAAALNARKVPTSSGRGVWYASTVMRGLDGSRWAAYMRDYRKNANEG